MRPANCERCGEFFMSFGARMCPDCAAAEQKYLRRAKEELYKRPDMELMELAELADIPMEVLEDLLSRNLLQFRRMNETEMRCEMCGKPVVRAKRCLSCNSRISKMVKAGAAAAGGSKAVGMHTLDFNRGRGRESEGKKGAM